MKKKLDLQSLKVKSFVTTIEGSIRGGDPSYNDHGSDGVPCQAPTKNCPPTNVCNTLNCPTENIQCITQNDECQTIQIGCNSIIK